MQEKEPNRIENSNSLNDLNQFRITQKSFVIQNRYPRDGIFYSYPRRDHPVGVPLDLSTPVMEWNELPKYNGIQVSQLIYSYSKAEH